LKERTLSEGHGKVLAGVPAALQLSLAQQCVSKRWSVRQLEQAIKKAQHLHVKPTLKKDPNLALLEKSLADYLAVKYSLTVSKARGT